MTRPIKILFIVITLSINAYAQMLPPSNVTSNGFLYGIKINWNKSVSGNVTHYKIYRWVVTFPVFVKIAEVNATPSNDYSYHDFSTEAGLRYYYYITASSGMSESNASNQTSAKLKAPGNSIVIISEPLTQYKLGPPAGYYYHLMAVSPDTSSVLSYNLLIAPNGMNINNKGEITWSNPNIGTYIVVVKVQTSPAGQFKSAAQVFKLHVVQQTGSITGLVQSTSGMNISKARVLLFNVNNPDHIYEIIAGNNGVFLKTDVAVGTYYAVAEAIKNGYGFRWYPNALKFVDASPIVITEDQVTSADFLTSLPPVGSSQTVTGIVKDTLNNPLANVLVSAFAADKYYPIGKDSLRVPHSIIASKYDILTTVFNTTTNASGQFSINLPQGRLYYLRSKKNGFRTSFRGDVFAPLNAKPLLVNSNPEQSVFTMKPNAPTTYTIKGTLLDASTQEPIIISPVILVQRGGGHVMFATATADTGGTYEFNNVEPGTYSLLAAPIGNHIPAYYKDNGTTLFWQESDSIQITNADKYDVDINVPSTKKTGLASIAGQVTNSATGDAINTLSVFAYEISDTTTAVTYAVTDSNGYYKVDGLLPGTYVLKTDKGGYNSAKTSQITVNYTGSISITNISIEVTVSNVTVIPPADVFDYMLEQNYPNPVSIRLKNVSTTIGYAIPKNTFVTLKIFNSIGQEIRTLVREMKHEGFYRVQFDGSDLPSGVYFYQLQADNKVITKQMVLLR